MLGGIGTRIGTGAIGSAPIILIPPWGGVGARGPVKHAKNAGERASLKQLERGDCRPHMFHHDGGLRVVGDLTALHSGPVTRQACEETFCFYGHPHRCKTLLAARTFVRMVLYYFKAIVVCRFISKGPERSKKAIGDCSIP